MCFHVQSLKSFHLCCVAFHVYVGVCVQTKSESQQEIFSAFQLNNVGGGDVFCVEFSPSLRSQARHKKKLMSCQGIMTSTDLFKALTRWQCKTKKQLILCVQDNLVCVTTSVCLCPNPLPPSLPPKKTRTAVVSKCLNQQQASIPKVFQCHCSRQCVHTVRCFLSLSFRMNTWRLSRAHISSELKDQWIWIGMPMQS